MSKAIEGAAMIAGGVLVDAAIFFGTFGTGAGLVAWLTTVEYTLLAGGVALEAGAAVAALSSTGGAGYTIRQPAPFRQIIYGVQRVGGIFAFISTSGSRLDQNNFIIILAGHPIDSIENLYLDGRQVFWAGGVGNVNRGGVNFGGAAAGGSHTGPDGQQYDFGGLVYCEARYGDQTDTSAGPDFPSYYTSVIGGATANDATWGPTTGANTPRLMGCAYVYLKMEYNTAMFPSTPGSVEIKFTIRGKNDIWDPRTGSKGFSTNPALIVADIIRDTVYGLGDVDAFKESGSVAQLVAAANVCDEQVSVVATGGSEARYAAHYTYNSSAAPGNVMGAILQAMGGRISQPGGEWYIFPAYWQGPSFAFDSGALTGALTWEARSQKDLYNRVTGTYIAPNWPWNTAGNQYDRNGFYNGRIANNFPFAFQPSSFPQYAADPAHGYAADQYLDQDSNLLGPWASGTTYNLGDVIVSGGAMYKSLIAANVGNAPATSPVDWVPYANLLPTELTLRSVLSVTQAQRLAKIHLLRNRFGGSGKFPMAQAAFAMQCCDVMQFTFAAMGWAGKTLEIEGVSSTINYGAEGEAPSEQLEINVIETDISVYQWNAALEEQTVYGAPASPQQLTRYPNPPTGMSLTSGAATALVALDGTVTPRVEVQWTTPLDILTTQIQIQYQLVAGGVAGSWLNAGYADVSQNAFFVSGVVSGLVYNFRIRGIRGTTSGASVWVEVDGYTVSIILSVVTSTASAPSGTLIGEAFSPAGTGGAAVIVEPYTATYGTTPTAILPAGEYTISGLTQQLLYYVYYIDPTFAGGAITPIATTSQADYLGKVGYFFIGSIVTPLYSSGGVTARFRPTVFNDTGTRTTSNPATAYDGILSTYATVTALSSVDRDLYGSCQWFGWSSLTTTSAANLYINISSFFYPTGPDPMTHSVTVSSSLGTIASDSGGPLSGLYSIAIPIGTDISTITVTVYAQTAKTGTPTHPPSGGVNELVHVYEIYIAP
jgi:hypothetical protein